MPARLLAFVLRGNARPLCTQIADAFRLEPAARRIVALALLYRMLRSELPVMAHTALNWHSLGSLLLRCSIDLHPNPHSVPPIVGDQPRVDWFAALSRDAFALSSQIRRDVRAQRPARGVPLTERAPRNWKPSGRVIDTATLTTGGAS